MIKKYLFSLVLFKTLFVSCQPYKLEVHKVSDFGSSRATAYIDNNKIVSQGDTTRFIAYLDNQDNKFRIKVAKINGEQVTTHLAVDGVTDNHGGGALILDREGYLHLFHSGHQGNLYHLKNVTKGDTQDWAVVDTVPGLFTYPSVAYDPISDYCYVLLRERGFEASWNISFLRKNINKKFEPQRKLILSNYDTWKAAGKKLHFTQSGYSRWNKTIVAGKGREIYVFFRNYEYVPSELDYGYFDNRGGAAYFTSYLFSNDNGDTWKSGTTTKKSSFYPEDLALLSGNAVPERHSGFHNISNIFPSAEGAYTLYTKTAEDQTAELHITYLEKGEIAKKYKVTVKDEAYEIIGPAALARDAKGNFFILASGVPKNVYCNCTDDWGRESNILILIALDQQMKVMQQVRIDSDFFKKNHGLDISGPFWLPSTEYYKAGDGPPTFIFTIGQKGSDNKEIVYNKVYSLKVH